MNIAVDKGTGVLNKKSSTWVW